MSVPRGQECFVCKKPATTPLRIPCAPGGKVWVCDEHAPPGARSAVFEAYRSRHEQRIREFKSMAL